MRAFVKRGALSFAFMLVVYGGAAAWASPIIGNNAIQPPTLGAGDSTSETVSGDGAGLFADTSKAPSSPGFLFAPSSFEEHPVEFGRISIDVARAPAPTPEPGTFMLFGSGLVGLVGVVRRKLGKSA